MYHSDKVQSSAAGKLKLKKTYEDAGFTQERLSQEARVSVDTIKRLLGTKACPNGIERHQVISIANILGIQATDIISAKDWYPNQQLPEEFEALIAEKIRWFCGREFVFAAFDEFLQQSPKGYFTVVGDAGMGKSALAAKYVSEHYAVCYFNVLAERRNRPELFLDSVRQQLAGRYELQNVARANLATLLEKASQRLAAGERLVIVIDALDEVEQEPDENLLHLPTTLPDGVYFLLTRRPYNLDRKQLSISPGIPTQELDLTTQVNQRLSKEDIKAYIYAMLYEHPEYRGALKSWIRSRQLTVTEFIEQITAKSENNFMYLRYVLPAIADGLYNDLTLRQLPQGLQEYYQTHWVRMRMDETAQAQKAIILFILVEIGTPITLDMIAEIAEEDEYEVSYILENDWVEYLRKQIIEGEQCYSIYHGSFLDFLKHRRELKSSRKLLQEVNESIVKYFDREDGRYAESN